MVAVPLALAVISAVSPVVAGGLPLLIGWLRDVGRDKRGSAERLAAERLRLEQEKRGECVRLLKLARDYRVLVEDAYESRGSDLAAYTQKIRQSSADINGQADEVGFMVPAAETTASSLAAEANRLSVTLADKKNTVAGAPLVSPNFTMFDQCLEDFKATALAAMGRQPAVSAGGAGIESGERPQLQATGSGA
jgi:hypothetical protein